MTNTKDLSFFKCLQRWSPSYEQHTEVHLQFTGRLSLLVLCLFLGDVEGVWGLLHGCVK